MKELTLLYSKQSHRGKWSCNIWWTPEYLPDCALCRPRLNVFQNIQIFSPCLTGLWLAYQTSNEKCDFPSSPDVWIATSPPVFWGKEIICPFTVLQSVWSCFLPLNGNVKSSNVLEVTGALKSKTVKNNNLLSCWISIGLLDTHWWDTKQRTLFIALPQTSYSHKMCEI